MKYPIYIYDKDFTRSRLENKYQNTMSPVHKVNFKKHKNYCNRLYKRERKNIMKV